MSPVAARRAGKLVLQTAFPSFTLRGDFLTRGSRLSINVGDSNRRTPSSLIISPQVETNRVEPFLNFRQSRNTRLEEVYCSPAQRDELRFVCRVLSNALPSLSLFGTKATPTEVSNWLDRADPDKLKDAMTKCGVKKEDIVLMESGLSCSKPYLEFRAFYESFLTNFGDIRVDPAGFVWEAEFGQLNWPVAWKRFQREELGLPDTTNGDNWVKLEEFVHQRLLEWRRSNQSINVWAGSFCGDQTNLTRKILNQIKDGPEVALYHPQPDLYVFYNEFVTAESDRNLMRDITGPLYPYWHSSEDRPMPTEIVNTAAYKIMKDQGWTHDTMWAFWTHVGIALLRSSRWCPNSQMVPLLFGVPGTGKSCLLDMLGAMFHIDHQWTFNPGDSDSFLTGGLGVCRLILWPETKSNSGPSLVLFKQIAENARITVNGKWKDTFQMNYRGAFWLNGNREFWPTPKYRHESGRLNDKYSQEMFEYGSIARRIAMFPFYTPIPAHQRIRDLDERIKKELPIYISTALYCVHRAKEAPEDHFARHLSSAQMFGYQDNLFRFQYTDENDITHVSESVCDKLPEYTSPTKHLSIFAS